MSNNFLADLAYGQLGEEFVKQIGRDITIEVKKDRKWHVTGNIFIEVACNKKASGIMSTEAMYLAYLLEKDSEHVAFYFFDVNRLKLCITSMVEDKLARRVDWAGDGGRVEGIVLPLKDIGELIMRMGQCTIKN